MGTISSHVDAETPGDALDIAAHLEKLIPPLELVRMDPDAPECERDCPLFLPRQLLTSIVRSR